MSDTDPRSQKSADSDRVQAVLDAVSEALPQVSGGSDPLSLSRDLIASRETEEGLRLVAWAIHDARARVPAWVVASIRDLTVGTFPGSELPAELDDLVE